MQNILFYINKLPLFIIILLSCFFVFGFFAEAEKFKKNSIGVFVDNGLPIVFGYIHWILWAVFGSGIIVAFACAVVLKKWENDWIAFVVLPILFIVNFFISYVFSILIPVVYLWQVFLVIAIYFVIYR